MRNLIVIMCLILSGSASTSLAGTCANGNCARPVLNGVKTVVTAPVRISKRVVTLPSKVRYNRTHRTSGSVDHTTFDRNGYD